MTAEKHETLAAALAAFQENLPVVLKGSTASIPGRAQYKYADLADLSAAVLPALGRQGLSWLAMPTYTDAGNFVLRYELLHTSGEHRTGEYALPLGRPQEIGSALTYARRQCLSAVTGVAADEDDDGATAQNAATPQRRTPQRPEPAQAAPATTGTTAAQARSALALACKDNGWDIDIVESLWLSNTDKPLGEATDAARIDKFRTYLYSLPQADLMLSEPAAAPTEVPA